jgi:hypothetical protein
MDCKYPEIKVRLVGEDGNAFAIIARVAQALRGHGCDRETVTKFRSEAMSGDYDNLLRTCFAWVSCDTYDEDDEDDEDTCGWCDAPHSECECVDL